MEGLCQLPGSSTGIRSCGTVTSGPDQLYACVQLAVSKTDLGLAFQICSLIAGARHSPTNNSGLPQNPDPNAKAIAPKSHCPHLLEPPCPPLCPSIYPSIHPQDVVRASWLSAPRLFEEVAGGFLPFPQAQTQG